VNVALLNWKDPAALDAGGAERYVKEIADSWSSAGHDVIVVVPQSGQRPDADGSQGRYLHLGNRRTVFPLARAWLRSAERDLDLVIESVSTRPFFSHRIVGRRAVALYHQMADDVWDHEVSFPLSWAGRYIIEPHWVRGMRGSRIVAVSRSTAADLARYGVTVEAINPPGCVPVNAAIHDRPPGPPRLVFAGRLVKAKRPMDALQAFEALQRTEPAATLDIIGDGYLRVLLTDRARRGVTVHGFVSEELKNHILSRADLLLLPGTREGWGIVALEAAMHGVPAVAYNVPGLRDAVVDNVTGCLCDATPSAMARTAETLLRTPARLIAMSAAARHHALEYSWEKVASRLWGICADNAASPRRQAAREGTSQSKI